MSEQEIEKPYVMIWQRAMNSGIVAFDSTTLERVKKIAYKPEYVKTTIIQGTVVDQFGEMG